ncbi:hypothetical protein ABZP36_029509 [Zizania latifolia]
MHVLASHLPPPLSALLLAACDLGCRDHQGEERIVIGGGGEPGVMDEVLSQISEAFRLAGELMAELPATQNDPAYLAARCHAIAHAYSAAVRMLQGHAGVDASAAAAAAMGPAHPFGGEGAGGGYGHQRPPLDLLRSTLFLGADPPAQQQQLGCGPHLHHHQHRHDPEQHQPSLREAYAVGAGATSSGGPVRRLASSSSRSSPPSPVPPRQGRRRRESGEKVTVMVAALRTGNTELPPDDGYTWRKYGQKDILGSRYPREQLHEYCMASKSEWCMASESEKPKW